MRVTCRLRRRATASAPPWPRHPDTPLRGFAVPLRSTFGRQALPALLDQRISGAGAGCQGTESRPRALASGLTAGGGGATSDSLLQLVAVAGWALRLLVLRLVLGRRARRAKRAARSRPRPKAALSM